MFTKSTRLNQLLSIAFFFVIAGCGDIGGGCGCTAQPLPGGALPADQTVEGGGQIRVTAAGFQKLTSIIPAVINDMFTDGFCIGGGSIGAPDFTGADYCSTNQSAVGGSPPIPDSCGSANGCNVGVRVDEVNLMVTDDQVLNVQVQLDIRSIVPLDGAIVFVPASCNMSVTGSDLLVDVDIVFGIDPGTGELTLSLANINNFDTSGLSASDCGIVSAVVNGLNSILNSFVGDFLIDILTPTLDGLVQGFLPDPLGIEGMIDVGTLVGGISPGTEGFLEARMVPGGYVDLERNGLSLGLITGLNADEDPSTRTPDLDSEPHYCVPPIPAPDFAAAPASLGHAPDNRPTFFLEPAEEFLGIPEPADDLVIGLSETTLDLAGHHLVTSGGMCLGVGTTLIAQLNLGTFSLLVPSLAGLGESTNPVLLVTRPQKALDFTIGEGGEGNVDSPALTIDIRSFEADVYVYVYERYTRAFTMKLDLAVGINLSFEQLPGMPATVTPQLVGLEADNVTVEVLNSEFVSETPEQLEEVLPTIFDLAVGLLGDGLGAIEVPNFAGFTLNNLRTVKVTTTEDDFLAIYASLGSSQMLRDLASEYPSLNPVLATIDTRVQQARAALPAARIVSVDTPSPSHIRMALHGHPDAHLPTVTVDVDARDGAGRELEYTWRLGDTGLWRPFRSGPTLSITDRALAWQGKYALQLRSRVKGDYTTTSEIASLPIIVDSVGPEILVDRASFDGATLIVPATDIVSPPTALQWAYGTPGEDEPSTAWQPESALAARVVESLALDGEILVFAKDEVGNVSVQLAKVPFHGQAGESGCSCDTTGGAPSGGALVLMLLTVAILATRSRSRRLVLAVTARASRRGPLSGRSIRRLTGVGGLWVGIVVLSSMVPACNCGGDPGVENCEVTEDCTSQCPEDAIPFCLDGTCVCIDDVPYGRIGPYSDVAVNSNGDAWVSAYAESHGDLVIAQWDTDGRIVNEAWEFVDGVPDGPVAIPDSDIRGGITAAGQDVGMYTSIAVAPDDTPMVTYFDRDDGSLKFAARSGDVWQIHVIDEGTGNIDPELGGEMAGMYSALTLRSDDGRPGVAYMATVSEGGGVSRAEVRFAASQTPSPSSASDWVFWTVDSVVLPPAPETADPTPIPGGMGLFMDATRDPSTQAPVLAYYDRVNGNLKLARFDATAGAFPAPTVLAGDDGSDVGLYPSVVVDAAAVAHVSYQSATRDDLLYINSADLDSEIVDDGYRIVGTTDDGLPKPEFHFVGDDSNMMLAPTGPVIVYQDATSHELLYSAVNAAGVWQRRAIAGAEAEFVGAYGFFASAVVDAEDLIVSTWVIDQPHNDQWVEIFRERIVVD